MGSEMCIRDRLLEAYTHFITGNHREAFICGWPIIEYHINIIWEELIKKITNKDRRQKLKDPNYVNIDHIIEILCLFDLVNEEEYTQLMKLKRVRNRVVHKLYVPSTEEIKELFDIAYKIVLMRLAQLQ